MSSYCHSRYHIDFKNNSNTASLKFCKISDSLPNFIGDLINIELKLKSTQMFHKFKNCIFLSRSQKTEDFELCLLGYLNFMNGCHFRSLSLSFMFLY